MKKFILLLLLSILAWNASAQSYLGSDASIVLKGGYNFNAKQPTTNLSLVGDFAFVRVAFNLNYAIVQNKLLQPDYIPFFSPAIGFTYGMRSVYYLMFGTQMCGIFNNDEQKKSTTGNFCFLLETGCDIPLSNLLFFNLAVQYWLPSKNPGNNNPYQGFNLMAGLGFYL